MRARPKATKQGGEPRLDETVKRLTVWSVLNGDVAYETRKLGGNSFDAALCDPPYGLNFMGRDWDRVVPGAPVWRSILQVLKPGAPVIAFGGTRTFHRLAVALEDAGAEMFDCFSWMYGCLDDESECLTRRGWARYDEIEETDDALAFDLETGELRWERVERVVSSKYEGPMVVLEGDGFLQRLTAGHRVVLRCDEQGWGIVEAGEIAGATVGEDLGELRGVRARRLEVPLPREEDLSADVFEAMRRRASGAGVGEARTQGACGVDSGERSVVSREDERGEEPGLEGGRDLLPEARELQADQVRPVPGRASIDVSQGRVRHGAPAHRGEGDRAAAHEDRSGAPRGSQSPEQRDRESRALDDEPRSQVARGGARGHVEAALAACRVERHEGVVWCITVSTGAFVARRNGRPFVTGNTGFPKSLDAARAIDSKVPSPAIDPGVRKVCAYLREMMGRRMSSSEELDALFGTHGMAGHWTAGPKNTQPLVPNWQEWLRLREHLRFGDEMDAEVWRLQGYSGPPVYEERDTKVRKTPRVGEAMTKRKVVGEKTMTTNPGMVHLAGSMPKKLAKITEPHLPEARRYKGHGTALKPAWEPALLFRKPSDGTLAENIARHDVGALAIDACRIGATKRVPGSPKLVQASKHTVSLPGYEGGSGHDPNVGRWPANVLLDEHAAELLDKQSGPVGGTGAKSSGPSLREGNTSVARGRYAGLASDKEPAYHGVVEGASRFFYVSKASASERDFGLERFEQKKGHEVAGRKEGSAGAKHGLAGTTGPRRNVHPTVKPIGIAMYLARLLLPPPRRDGAPRRILVPFSGSGSEMIGAMLAGWDEVVGIERDREFGYIPIAEARMRAWQDVLIGKRPVPPWAAKFLERKG